MLQVQYRSLESEVELEGRQLSKIPKDSGEMEELCVSMYDVMGCELGVSFGENEGSSRKEHSTQLIHGQSPIQKRYAKFLGASGAVRRRMLAGLPVAPMLGG